MFRSVFDYPLNIKYYPEFDFSGDLSGVRAITFDGMPFIVNGQPMKTKVFAYIGFPEKFTPTESGKMPGIVLVHGGGGHAFGGWVKMWNDRGYAAVAMDVTGDFPEKPGYGTVEGAPGSFVHGPHAVFAEDGYTAAPANSGMTDCGTKPMSQHWMYHAIADCILARRLLAADERVDPDCIGITGISWGGIITSLVIGHDSALKFAIPVYGSGYLGEDCSLGLCALPFQDKDARRFYLAEDRFAQVNTPVLWLCSNTDTFFSIMPNSLSYRDTKDGNALTRLSILSQFGHSHAFAWNRACIMDYADAVVYGNMDIPRIGDITTDGENNIVCDYECDGESTAVLRYIKAAMTYSTDSPYSWNGSICIDQEWHDAPCTLENGKIKCSVPADAVGMYVELCGIVNGGDFAVCSQYVENRGEK
ncbi:MAG: prolyl oligopeptidase family serine peptidase [Clostridia bacterium]|nr:prolyl oligopeptidase family serine peptidase [Clostridia bacterium]